MQSLGVKAGIINAAGDIATWGKQLNGQPWLIGVNNPFETGETIEIFEFIENNAVTTSGNYEKYAEIADKRYSHIINPKTLYPSNYMKSVTVISDDSALADLLSTTLFLMPIEDGKEFIKDYQVEVIWYTNDNQVIKTAGVSQYE